MGDIDLGILSSLSGGSAILGTASTFPGGSGLRGMPPEAAARTELSPILDFVDFIFTPVGVVTLDEGRLEVLAVVGADATCRLASEWLSGTARDGRELGVNSETTVL